MPDKKQNRNAAAKEAAALKAQEKGGAVYARDTL